MVSYLATRLTYTPKRKLVWEEICTYLNQRFIPKDARILELGPGYGDFIGNIRAAERVAIEMDKDFQPFIERYPDVNVYFSDALSMLKELKDDSFDVVLCSNYFEHFELDDVRIHLRLIRKVLERNGRLIIIQPNYQICYSHYFDDWTHRSIFSHTSLSDLLEIERFSIVHCRKKFLPFTMKSRLPIGRILVRMYLYSPIKPFAGQFLLVATTG